MASREGLQFLMQNMILLQMLFQAENLTQFMLKQHIALMMTLDWFQEFDIPKILLLPTYLISTMLMCLKPLVKLIKSQEKLLENMIYQTKLWLTGLFLRDLSLVEVI